ncbi:MAG: type III PLP-dependent enzyme [Pseudomonadota bacterium]
MERYLSPREYLAARDAWDPVVLARPEHARAAARWFLNQFPGEVLYAAKTNPEPWLIDALYETGVRWFDVASTAEIELVAARCPDATLAFMHPVKSREAIRRAYWDYGVRIFALDSEAELRKIVEETGGAKDLELIVRLAVSGDHAAIPLSNKFGAARTAAPALLRAARAVADELGVSFHVGSQCLDPQAYRIAMREASDRIVEAGVTVDIVDVGGGFPALYPGMEPPPVDAYMRAINEEFEEMIVLYNADLWCEPGRALAAEAASLLTRVELVKPGSVYLNDGAFGALYDAARENWRYPVRVMSEDGAPRHNDGEAMYRVFGPTCDSADRLANRLALPANIAEGDYIEFGMLGAYGATMATRFNGFGAYDSIEVGDAPFASLYRKSADIVALPSVSSATATR